mgnify:CR=1 FL=1
MSLPFESLEPEDIKDALRRLDDIQEDLDCVYNLVEDEGLPIAEEAVGEMADLLEEVIHKVDLLINSLTNK